MTIIIIIIIIIVINDFIVAHLVTVVKKRFRIN